MAYGDDPSAVPPGSEAVAIGPPPLPFTSLDPASASQAQNMPWSPGEYLCDGGDAGLQVQITPDGQVNGLDPEDAVASYRAPDGRTLVEPSNRICIYSPRFRAVRQVIGLQENDQAYRLTAFHLPTGIAQQQDVARVRSSKQHIQPQRDVGTRSLTTYRTRQGMGMVSATLEPRGFHHGFLPHEDFSAIRLGAFQEAEMGRLLKAVNAAVAWSHNQAVQVILDQQAAAEEAGREAIGSIYTVTTPPGHPRLRVIKVASTQFAEPGDTIDFTIRFDNVGDQLLNSVTILDNLPARLEYVPDSAQASIPAQFTSAPNEAGSTVLRWEMAQPLRPGQGGILRFRCLVR